MKMLAASNVARGAHGSTAMHRRREESRDSIFGIVTVGETSFGGIRIVLYVVSRRKLRWLA
jgi:hypothetical protein